MNGAVDSTRPLTPPPERYIFLTTMGDERYSRQVRFSGIGPAGQKKIGAGRVAVIGVGALGTVSANVLARAGVGRLRLVDRDVVDRSNLQRQVLFTERDAEEARPKAIAAAEFLRSVNSEIEIEPVVREVTPRNVEGLIRDVDVVVDGSDNFELRYLLNDACVKQGVPWVYGGAIGACGSTLAVVPGETACLHCFNGPMPPPGSVETCSTAGVLAMVTGIIGNTQAAEALKLLVGTKTRPTALLVDLWNGEFSTITVRKNDRCPVCGRGEYVHLNARRPTRVSTFCGQHTIQISPAAEEGTFSLQRLASQWKRSIGDDADILLHDQVLRLRTTEFEMTVFTDRRALIRGVGDEPTARAIYNEYIGT